MTKLFLNISIFSALCLLSGCAYDTPPSGRYPQVIRTCYGMSTTIHNDKEAMMWTDFINKKCPNQNSVTTSRRGFHIGSSTYASGQNAVATSGANINQIYGY